MPAIKAPSKVLVTGASGFIAVSTLKTLVDRGYNVVGTVRSKSKGEYLEKLLGPLFTYAIVENIESPDAFDEVVKSGEFAAVVHMASPVTLLSNNPSAVIGPAVAGTKNILSAVSAYGPSVRRVIITASMVSIFEPKDGVYTFTESDWNYTSQKVVEKEGLKSSGFEIYRASKSVAEQAAWKFVQDNKSSIKFDLTTIHPPLVFGPILQQVTDIKSLNETSALLLNQLTTPGAPIVSTGNYVDVRDVAEAHALALEVEAAGGERFITSAGIYDPSDWKKLLIEAKFTGIAAPGPASSVIPTALFDNSKSKRVLGLTYHSGKETVIDSFTAYVNKFPSTFKA